VLTARAYFHRDAEIVGLATSIYGARRDWPWMLNGEETFSMGWRNGAFLKSRWNHYCELMLLYLLAIGSPTHPIDPACWDAMVAAHDALTPASSYIGAADPPSSTSKPRMVRLSQPARPLRRLLRQLDSGDARP